VRGAGAGLLTTAKTPSRYPDGALPDGQAALRMPVGT
jgi:hypothetical protein